MTKPEDLVIESPADLPILCDALEEGGRFMELRGVRWLMEKERFPAKFEDKMVWMLASREFGSYCLPQSRFHPIFGFDASDKDTLIRKFPTVAEAFLSAARWLGRNNGNA